MAALNPWDYADRYGAEHAHQVALLMWANMAFRFGLTAANYKESYNVANFAGKLHEQHWDHVPELEWLHAIHNQGHGDVIRGGRAKAEGVKAGVFDLFLPVPVSVSGGFNGALPRQNFAGLYIEMKVGKNQPTNDQLRFKTHCENYHYAAHICWGWLEARDKILDYLQLPRYKAAITLKG